VTTKINLNAAAKSTGLRVKTLRRYIANGVVSTYRLSPGAICVDVDDIAQDTRTGSPLSIPAIASDEAVPCREHLDSTRAVMVGGGDRGC
jgi:hypothetical protein